MQGYLDAKGPMVPIVQTEIQAMYIVTTSEEIDVYKTSMAFSRMRSD